MDDEVRWTVRPLSKMGFFISSCDELHSTSAPPYRNRKRVKGFCLNDSCMRSLRIKTHHYQLSAFKKNIFTTIYSTFDQIKHSCIHCEHALFWTREWIEYKTTL